jgi:hypothetical protein
VYIPTPKNGYRQSQYFSFEAALTTIHFRSRISFYYSCTIRFSAANFYNNVTQKWQIYILMMVDHPTPTIMPLQTMDILMRSSTDREVIWDENHRLLRAETGRKELLLLGLEGMFKESFVLSPTYFVLLQMRGLHVIVDITVLTRITC